MKRNWKRLLLTSLVLGLLGSATAYAQTVSMNLYYNGKNHAYAAEEVKIEIDGKALVPKDMPAVIIEGRTMLPMRLIAQELGCEVTWNEEARQAYVINDEYTVVFTMDSKTGYQNGTEFTMDVPATVVNDRTMLPVRALAKALDLEIAWDDPSRTVSIGTSAEEEPPAPAEPNLPAEPGTPVAPSGAAVTLNRIGVPAKENAGQVFTIQANGAISRWEETYVDEKKIVLDFYNAKSGLPEKITATNSSIVSAIRTALHSEDGVDYLRVVFDLTGKKHYEITQSSDKTQLFITFDKVTVEDVSVRNRNDVDYITISADGALGANVFTLSKPNRIVVDLPNVEADEDLEETIDIGDLQYVTAGRIGKFTESTLRLVFEVGDLTEYSCEEGNYDLKLEIRRSTLEHMIYDSDDETLYLDKVDKFDTDDAEIEDHYLDGYALVRLPGDFKDVYGYGTYRIGGDILNTIQVSNIGGQTVFRFNQSRINAYEIEDEGDRYAIRLKNPRDVYDHVLLLDAGHGGKDPGTSGNGLVEKNLTLTMLQKVNRELQGSGIKVYLTRDSDVYPENNTRAKTANEIAHMMVSIHMNAAQTPLPNGTETLYQVHASDGRLTSKRLAEILLNHIIAATGNNNRGIKLRDDLLILNGTTVPTVIVETVFLSNAGDALKISDSAYQDKVARAIAEGIMEAMELI